MKKSLSLVASSVLMVMSQSVSAIGVGQVKVKSFLNEPLSLELPITGSNTQDVSVAMASYQQAERLGVSIVGLHNFKARVVEDASGKKIVISSNQPYKEPIADLAIVLRFPGGELVKGVSAFIDPAGLSAAESIPTSQTGQPTSTQETVTAQVGDNLTLPTEQKGSGLPPTQTYKQDNALVWGPTQRNDSLWKIASQLRGQYNASIHQLMMAIFQRNPQAFSNGRIDRLKMGYMLTLPSQAEASRLTNSQAVALFGAASRGSVATQVKPLEETLIPREAAASTVPSSLNTPATTTAPATFTASAEIVATKPAVATTTPEFPGDNQTDDQQIAVLQQRLQETQAVEENLQQENVVLKQQLDEVMARVERIQSRYAELETASAQLQQQEQAAPVSSERQPVVDETVFVAQDSSVTEVEQEAIVQPAITEVANKRNYGLYLLMFLAICSLAFISLLSFYIFKRKKRKPAVSDEFSQFEPVAKIEQPPQPAAAVVAEKRQRAAAPSLDKVNRDSVNFDMIKTSAEAYFAYGRYKDAVDLIEFEIEKRHEQPDFVRLLGDYLVDLETRINDNQTVEDVAEYFVDEESEAQLAEDDLQALQDSVLEELEQELNKSKDKFSKKAS